MNDRELMQQVLDALEEIRYADISAVQDKAIENLRSRLTIRTRLAQPEQLPYWEPCNPGCDPEFNGQRSTYCAKLCHNAREALAAQPEPEPVAWITNRDLEALRLDGRRMMILYTEPITNGIETPLYTKPHSAAHSADSAESFCSPDPVAPAPSLWLAVGHDGRVKYTTDRSRATAWKASGEYRIVRDYCVAPSGEVPP